jgi:hypothetical protein
MWSIIGGAVAAVVLVVFVGWGVVHLVTNDDGNTPSQQLPTGLPTFQTPPISRATTPPTTGTTTGSTTGSTTGTTTGTTTGSTTGATTDSTTGSTSSTAPVTTGDTPTGTRR